MTKVMGLPKFSLRLELHLPIQFKGTQDPVINILSVYTTWVLLVQHTGDKFKTSKCQPSRVYMKLT